MAPVLPRSELVGLGVDAVLGCSRYASPQDLATAVIERLAEEGAIREEPPAPPEGTPATLEGILAAARSWAEVIGNRLPSRDSVAIEWTVNLESLRCLLEVIALTAPGRSVAAFPLPEEEERNRAEAAHEAAGRAYYLGITHEVPSLPRWEGLRDETQAAYCRAAGEVVAAYERARHPQ